MSFIPIETFDAFDNYARKKEMPIIWRGQTDFGWELIPSAFRKLKARLKSEGKQEATDEEAKDVKETEMQMLELFKKQAQPHLTQLPSDNDNYRWLSLAQHHNLPTRLLDWTESHLVALFFAVEKEDYEGDASAVHFFEFPQGMAEHKNPFDVDKVYLYSPHHISRRIIVQRSCFTVHPTNYLVVSHKMPNPTGLIRIPNECREEMRNTLDHHYGINRSTLFPDLDSIARKIAADAGFTE